MQPTGGGCAVFLVVICALSSLCPLVQCWEFSGRLIVLLNMYISVATKVKMYHWQNFQSLRNFLLDVLIVRFFCEYSLHFSVLNLLITGRMTESRKLVICLFCLHSIYYLFISSLYLLESLCWLLISNYLLDLLLLPLKIFQWDKSTLLCKLIK